MLGSPAHHSANFCHCSDIDYMHRHRGFEIAKTKLVARLLCMVCMSVTTAIAAAQDLVLDKESPFFRELRAEPVPQTPPELLLKAELFNRGRINSEGNALAHWLDRTRILELLGEPLPTPPPHTIGEAIAFEKSAPENLEKLRRRAMEAVLTVERAVDSKADDFQYNGRIAYLGNGVWQGGATNRRVWIRVKATNHSARPIDLLGIRHEADQGRALDFWTCTWDGASRLAPEATQYAMCLDQIDFDKTPVSMRAITAAVLTPPLLITRIEMPDMRLIERFDTLPPKSDWTSNAAARAGEILAQVPCERLSSCAQIAQRKAEAAQREYLTSPQYFEKQRAERRQRGATRLNLGLAMMLVLTIGLAAMSGNTAGSDDGWGAGLAVAAIFGLGALVIACARALLIESPIAQGYGGYLVIIVGLGAAAVVAALLLWLGVTFSDSARRTRMRGAALGFGFSTLGIFASIFFP